MIRSPDMPLAEGEVIVWYQLLGAAEEARAPAYLELLSSEERARHDRLRSRDRLEFLTAHALLRRALSCHALGEPSCWRFETDDLGRPGVANSNWDDQLDFNLSHTDGLVACAVACGGAVGVDVECLDETRDVMRIARRILGLGEQKWLASLEDSERGLGLVDCWTLKEAHFKALGTGIRSPLSQLEFELGPGTDARLLTGPLGAHPLEAWHYLRAAPSSRHRLAAAAVGSVAPRWRLIPFPA